MTLPETEGHMTTTAVAMKSPKRRRGFRVSLRVFMLLVLVAGGGLGWKANKARRIRRAVAEVQRLGGSAYYDYEFHATKDRNSIPRPEPRWLQRLLGPEYFHDVRYVSINFPVLAADEPSRIKDLAFLSDLKELQWLYLANSGADDAAFHRLTPLPRLQVLSLYEPRVGDAGLAWLSGCHDLKMLTVSSPLCGDETARRVGRLKTLTKLGLYASKMTDEGVEALSSLDSLTRLDLFGENLGDRSLAVASRFPNLDWLTVGRLNRATNSGYGRLASLTKLCHLSLHGPSLANWDMRSMAALTSVEILVLSETNLGRTAISAESIPPSLRVVFVSNASIGDGSLDVIAKSPGLKTFEISDSELSDQAIRRLRRQCPAVLSIIRRKNGQPRVIFSEIDILDLL